MKNNHKLFLISTVFISSIALTGCTEQDGDTESSIPSSKVINEVVDRYVTSNVETALLGDDTLQNTRISVVTRKGDVLLTGEVNSQNLIVYAGNLVIGIKGVHTVHNHLTIKTL